MIIFRWIKNVVLYVIGHTIEDVLLRLMVCFFIIGFWWMFLDPILPVYEAPLPSGKSQTVDPTTGVPENVIGTDGVIVNRMVCSARNIDVVVERSWANNGEINLPASTVRLKRGCHLRTIRLFPPAFAPPGVWYQYTVRLRRKNPLREEVIELNPIWLSIEGPWPPPPTPEPRPLGSPL